MANEPHDGGGAAPKVSRRNLFKQAALAGAAAALPVATVAPHVAAQPAGPAAEHLTRNWNSIANG